MSGSPILQPSVSITLQGVQQTIQNNPQRVLMVGQKVAAGTATSGALVENVASANDPSDSLVGEDALFGASSMLAGMVRAFRKVNSQTRVDCVPLDDAAGTPRVVDVIFTGTATADGTITVIVASEVNHSFTVSIPSTTAASAIPALLVAAINADLDCPFTAADETAGEMSLTADNDGTVANGLGVEVITNVAGITLSQNVTEDTPGATDPTLTGVLDVATERYQAIVWPYEATAVLQTFLASRENPTNQLLDGVGFVSVNDSSLTNAESYLNALNDKNLVVFVDKQESDVSGSTKGYLGPAQNEATYVKSAIFAAIRALRLTEDASLANVVTTTASLDQFGGPALASLPYFNTPLPDLPAIAQGRGWTPSDIESILTAGGSVMGMNFTGSSALVGEVVTTYKTDSAANSDVTFKFLNYVDTSRGVREYMFNNLKSRFAQSRLTAGSISRGRDMANATVIRAFVEKLYSDLAGPDFVLVQDGEDAIRYFKTNLAISIALSTGTVTMTMLVPIVTQTRTITATISITFSTT